MAPRPALVFSRCGALVLFASACASLTAEQRAAALRVEVRASEPPTNCQNLGRVSGTLDPEGERALRVKAMLLGGNTIHAASDGTTTVLYCPPPKEPDAGAPEPTP